MHAALLQLCGRQVPGDTYRNLRIHPTFSMQTFKHVLVPIWLLTYHYGATLYQVIVNGYTGKMAGRYPKSPWKVAFLILVVVIITLVVLMLNEG